MIVVRVISLLLGALFIFAAYMSPLNPLVFMAASAFFFLMAYWSIQNKGAIDGPFVYFAGASVFFFYCISGLLSGQYTLRSMTVVRDHNPQGFWLVFAVSMSLGIGTLLYVYSKHRNRSV